MPRSFRKGSFLNQKESNNVPFKNGDICIITYFEDFSDIYVCKALHNTSNKTYDMIGIDVVLMTMSSTGELKLALVWLLPTLMLSLFTTS